MIEMIHTVTFLLADMPISLHMPHEMKVTDGFEPFITENTCEGFNVDVVETDVLKCIDSHSVFSNLFFSVHEDQEGFYRIFHERYNQSRQYAVGRICSDNLERIWYLKDSSKYFDKSLNTFSHIALEEILLRKNAVILHASFIKTEYGGILFTGPSGVGKSTQAELWVKYHGAEIINGDRTIIKEKDGAWKAYGSPYAGSSQFFVNKSCNIRAIVALEQTEECQIQRMDPVLAFIRLYSGMIVNTWNTEYVEKISGLTSKLAKEIPVYLLSCTPEKKAVDLLKNVLAEGEKL